MTNNSAMTFVDYSRYSKFTRMASPILNKNFIISSHAYWHIAFHNLWTITLFMMAGFRPHIRSEYGQNTNHQLYMRIAQ